MTITLLTMLVGLLAPAPSVPGDLQASVCPAETEHSRRAVTFFASSRSFARTRALHGLPTTDSASVRPLTAERDADACRQLRQFLVQYRPSKSGIGTFPAFYTASGYYYIYVDLERKGTTPEGRVSVDLRRRTLYVLDRDFKEVAAIAS